MFVPDNDRGQYWWLANTGASPEDNYIEMVCELLDERPRGCAIDVGANFGCWTLPLSRHAHHVWAFEPQPCVHSLLTQSIEKSGIRNVTTRQMAAGSRRGLGRIAALDIDLSTNFGGLSLEHGKHEQPDAVMEAVYIDTLDNLCCGERVSFIKVDVEGYESEVIAGATEILSRCKPLLFVEIEHQATDAERLIRTIENFGYVTEKHGGNVLGLPV